MSRRHRPPDPGDLLGVWAHPDDDAFLSAALMMRARQAGRRVVVATATRGEAGALVPGGPSREEMAAVREQEQARSLATLGVHEHRWLGHVDGLLPQVRRDSAVDQVAELILEVRPTTVVTFGPDGMTGHDDHRTVSSWVTEAWHRAGRPCALWYATLTPAFHRQWGGLNTRLGIWYPDAEPPATPPQRLAASVRCDRSTGELKVAALRAHASQIGGLEAAVGADRLRRWWSVESFVSPPAHVAHDQLLEPVEI